MKRVTRTINGLTVHHVDLAGEIGKVKSATVAACWPREAAYYGRNNWAGKLKRAAA